MPRNKYNVCRSQDGALVVCEVDLATARGESARLNAEAKVTNPETGQPVGLYLGAVVQYEVQSVDGSLVVA